MRARQRRKRVAEDLAGTREFDNASGGPAAISHIDFCFDYEVLVRKTAQPSPTRTFT